MSQSSTKAENYKKRKCDNDNNFLQTLIGQQKLLLENRETEKSQFRR